MSVQKQQYATSRSSLAGRQILNHLGDRGHVALWLGNNQHQCDSTYGRCTVFFPCVHIGMTGRLLRVFPESLVRSEDMRMLETAHSLPWVKPGMKLVAFKASEVGPDGIFVGDVWTRVRYALDQLCDYQPQITSSRRRRRGGHNEHLFPRYALS